MKLICLHSQLSKCFNLIAPSSFKLFQWELGCIMNCQCSLNLTVLVEKDLFSPMTNHGMASPFNGCRSYLVEEYSKLVKNLFFKKK